MAAATVAAAALSLPFLSHQSLWLDEVYTRSVLGAHTLAGLWDRIRATESTPPLYYLLAKLSTVIAGTRSAAAVRVPSALAFIASVPVGYLALRRLVGRRPALAAAAIIAVSPDLVQFATDARSYALFVLTGLTTVWGFSAARERGSARRYAAWAVACVACLWTHYFGAFLVGTEAVALLWLAPGRRRMTLAWSLGVVAAAAPLIPLLAHQNGSSDTAFIAGISLGSRLESTVRQFAMGANVPRAWLEGAGLAVAAIGVAVGAVRGSRALLAVAAMAFAAPLVLAVVGVEDRFYARNVVFVVPLVAGVAAVGLSRARAAPLAAYLALSVVTALWVATDWRYEQLDWRGAVARMVAVERAAPVIVGDPGNAAVVHAYLGRARVGAVRADALWVAVEPARPTGQRALTPVPATPSVPGFEVVRRFEVHGFRLVLERAPRATEVTAPPGTALFGP